MDRAAQTECAGDRPHHQIKKVSPVVWKLGWTSFLTNISSELVNSALPVYLVLHLHLSPLQYGTIDGLYNWVSVAVLRQNLVAIDIVDF
jgi:hypothetical protein